MGLLQMPLGSSVHGQFSRTEKRKEGGAEITEPSEWEHGDSKARPAKAQRGG